MGHIIICLMAELNFRYKSRREKADIYKKRAANGSAPLVFIASRFPQVDQSDIGVPHQTHG